MTLLQTLIDNKEKVNEYLEDAIQFTNVNIRDAKISLMNQEDTYIALLEKSVATKYSSKEMAAIEKLIEKVVGDLVLKNLKADPAFEKMQQDQVRRQSINL